MDLLITRPDALEFTSIAISASSFVPDFIIYDITKRYGGS